MFVTQLKITYAKNQENHKMNEKKENRYTNTGMLQMLQLSGKDFKAAIIKML